MTKTKKAVIFGTGSFAEMVHFFFENDSAYEVAGFTASGDSIKDERYQGLPVVPFEEVESAFPPGEHDMFIAVGYAKLNKVRARFFEEAVGKGYELATYVSSKASHWGATTIGRNVFIFEDNTIQPYVTIGDDVIMWSGNHVGHRVQIGDHCFLTSQVVISGHVKVGPYCFFGVNATVRDDVEIAEECIVGAGALILRSTQPRQVFSPKATEAHRVTSDRVRM